MIGSGQHSTDDYKRAPHAVFYPALARLPLSTVGAIEFLGTVVLAALGARTLRNGLSRTLAVGGVAVLTELRLADAPWGFVFAFADCHRFVGYVMLGHRIANTGVAENTGTGPWTLNMSGIDRLGAAMLVAVATASARGHADALGADPAATIRRLVDDVTDRLGDVSGDPLIQSAAGGMRLTAWLPTRTLTVHSLDLAASTDLTTRLPSPAVADAAAIAARRAAANGDGATVLQALTGRNALPEGFSVM